MMQLALQAAREAQRVAPPNPAVGCVIVAPDGAVIGVGHTQRTGGPHAEIMALRDAQARGRSVEGATVYVTLEPCAMCAAAISFARIRRLYFGVADPKGGAVENGVRFFAAPTCHHRPEVYGGIGAAEAAALLQRFFRARRPGGSAPE